MTHKQSHFTRYDLIILIMCFMAVSLLAIYNAQQLQQYGGSNFVMKQFVGMLLGSCLLF
ncbi:hypothetical protein [Paracerasibacillus soli]|uniref:Rod shape-determining protein RodA n=1 Tax=Paracerasibacillus soli TaxID=480284 RepID=A0ABU5CYC6_9BACI|nr:hypothetical protein [Virgibacillus soli]MDY0410485.1 hypothetical protein [Virgibacillus soli]